MFVAYPPMINWDIVDPSDRNRIISEAFNGQKSEKSAIWGSKLNYLPKMPTKINIFGKRKLQWNNPELGLDCRLKLEFQQTKNVECYSLFRPLYMMTSRPASSILACQIQ